MIIHTIIEICRNHPEIVIFLSLAIGYFIGKIKLFGFSLGSTAGVLLTALVLGQMNVQITPLIKAVAFALFIFTIGYKVGPQFFGALKKEGLNYIWLSIFVAIVGLITAVVMGKLFGFDKGTTAGLLGGAMTQSSILGTADGAIRNLPIEQTQKTLLESNIAVAYAITYIFGVAGLILFYKIVPRILGLNLKMEAEKLEQSLSGNTPQKDPEIFSWYKRVELRAYKIKSQQAEGKQINFVEKALFPGTVAIDKLKRGEKIIAPTPDIILQKNDIIAIVGEPNQFMKADQMIGPEVDDKSVLDVTGEILHIFVQKKQAIGKTLGQISKQFGRGCFLKGVIRQGHEIVFDANTIVEKADVLQVAGTKKDVENLVDYLGYPERPTSKTDLIAVGFGCALGTLLGLISVPFFGIPLTVGIGGGVLIAGLLFGWFHASHPAFGKISVGAQWVFINLGLNLFIACVGLIAGPRALDALKTTGISIFFAGIIVTLLPHIFGLIFGKFILKLNPVLLLGALTGAGTATPSLNVLKETCDSPAPALGFTVPYAFGNFILTIWGTLIVNLM